MRYCIPILLLLLSQFSLNAQRGVELGGWVGISNYFGDLNTSFDVSKPGLALGVLGRFNFNERLCLKFSLGYGSVSDTDEDSDNSFERARNLHFKSMLIDGSTTFEFNFLPYVHGSRDEWFTPYIFAGFNVFYFNPKAEYNGEDVELRPLGTEGQFLGEEYYSITGGLVYGIGAKLSMSYEWSVNAEFSARSLFTDYLDDVSNKYPDYGDLRSLRGQSAVDLADRSASAFVDGVAIGQEGRQRGNPETNDSYTILKVTLNYYFGDIRCPNITKIF